MEHALTYIIVFLCAFLACVVFDAAKVWHSRPERLVRELAMSKRRRERWVKRRIQFGISNMLEELYYRGRIERDERDFWLVRCANRLDMLDLLPRKNPVRYPDPEQLKVAIKGRIKKRTAQQILQSNRQKAKET